MQLFTDLPVVQLDWPELTPALLEERWRAMQGQRFNRETAWMGFWIARILFECLLVP